MVRKSADQNFPPALNQLATMYERGNKPNLGEAIRLYQLAAVRGDIVAKQNLIRLTGSAPATAPMASSPQPAPPPVIVSQPAPPSAQVASAAPPPSGGTITVPLSRMGGVLMVPVVLNEAVSAQFVVDSGASDLSVPESVVAMLQKAGKLSERDFTGSQKNVLADGSTIMSRTFILRQLRVGGKTLTNIRASVAPGKAPPLLGPKLPAALPLLVDRQ